MTINRATLPQEFFDTTSDRLLLAPEPQYLHARLWKNALNASLDPDAQLGLSIAGRQFGGNGAPYASAEMGRLAISDDIMTAAIEVVPELGKAPGHTVRLNRPSFTNTIYTEASREIASGTTISTTPVNVTSEQVPVTLKRYGGPTADSSGTGGVRPYSLDRFDGSVMLHRPAQIVGMNMKRDFDRTIDQFVVKLWDNVGTNIVRPAGFTTDDSHVVAGDGRMSYSLVAKLNRQMDEGNVPRFSNGKRSLILTPLQKEQLSQDSQFSRLSETNQLFNALYAGTYWKSVGDFDIFSSNTLSIVANTGTIPIHYAQAFGPGAIGSGVGEMPRVAYSTNDNYGETALLIWLMYAGFATLDSRLNYHIRTS